MNDLKKICIVGMISLFVGIFIGFLIKPNETIQPNVENQHAEVKTETKTETKIVYVPKYVDGSGVKEKTDIEATIGKPSVNVKINGHEAEIKKSDDEQFVFDKNKIVFDQNSKITIETKIDPVRIDKTKHWGIGAGYGSNEVGAILMFPIDKKKNLDGWVYADKEHKRGGIILRF